MKKILIIVPNFETGGTMTSLLNVLSLIDKDNYVVDVYGITAYGSLKEEAAKYANIYGASEKGNVRDGGGIRKKIFMLAKRGFKLMRAIGFDMTTTVLKKEVKKLQREKYDIVIAFQEGTATLMVSLFEGVKKIAWVRSQYSRYLRINKTAPEVAMYNRFNKIVCVSDASKKDFLSHLPGLGSKVVRVYDMLNAERILSLADVEIETENEEIFTIISIGRIDPVKRFSLIPEIASGLVGNGLKFKWLIIGAASEHTKDEEEIIRKGIVTNSLENIVLMLGRKTNPYPYLKNSNLLVCLSSSETFNYTLTEAKILGVPVVTTDYDCACESIENGKEGLIVPVEEISNTIESIICNKERYDALRKNIKGFIYQPEAILQDLYEKVLA